MKVLAIILFFIVVYIFAICLCVAAGENMPDPPSYNPFTEDEE